MEGSEGIKPSKKITFGTVQELPTAQDQFGEFNKSDYVIPKYEDYTRKIEEMEQQRERLAKAMEALGDYSTLSDSHRAEWGRLQQEKERLESEIHRFIHQNEGYNNSAS